MMLFSLFLHLIHHSEALFRSRRRERTRASRKNQLYRIIYLRRTLGPNFYLSFGIFRDCKKIEQTYLKDLASRAFENF